MASAVCALAAAPWGNAAAAPIAPAAQAPAVECMAPRGGTGCVAVGTPLAIVTSPDGRRVYTLARPARAGVGIRLTGFTRDPQSGSLRSMPAGCVVDRPSSNEPGCRTFGVLTDASTAVMSHDGRSLYVGTYLGEARALVALQFGSLGAIRRPERTSSVAGINRRPRCRTRSALKGAQVLAVSADDRTIYAADDDTIEVFSRNTRTGSLRSRGCYNSYGGSCHRIPRLHYIASLTPAPDGRRLYVGVQRGVVILRSDRRTAKLASIAAPAGCLNNEKSACPRLAGLGESAPASVSVSGNSRSVTVSAPGIAGAVEVLRRGGRRGALRRVMCLRPDALAGCRRARGPLSALLIASGGRTAYVVDTGGYLDALPRDPRSGALHVVRAGCVGPLALHGCTAAAGFVHFGDSDSEQTGGRPVLALSGDGRDVLVLESSGALIAARRTSGRGGLRAVACAYSENPAACAEGIRGLVAGRLGDTFALATSPDGANVYVGAAEGQAIAAFARNPVTGHLDQLAGLGGCVGPAQDGCTRPQVSGAVHSIAASPDGRYLYAVVEPHLAPSTGAARIAVLARADDGSLTPSNCCAASVWMNDRIRVSPDGRTLNAYGADRIRGFRRDPDTGELGPLDGPGGCVEAKYPGALPDPCDAVRGRSTLSEIAFSPDGKTLFALGDGITVFARDDRGHLTQLGGASGCIHDVPEEDCVVDPALKASTALVVSPDGRRAFVVAPFTSGDSGEIPESRLLSYARDESDGSITRILTPDACLATPGAGDGCRRVARDVSWAFIAFGLDPATQTLVGVDPLGNVAQIHTTGTDELGTVTTHTRCRPRRWFVRRDCPLPAGLLGPGVVSPDGASAYASTRTAIVGVSTR